MAKAGCGPAAEACSLPGGSYQLALPEGAGPFPAVVFLHGYGGTGSGTMSNTGMVQTLLARGYAVIAPDGQAMTHGDGDDNGGGNGRSWDFLPDRPATRDEVAFIKSVADDAAARFDLDRQRMLLAGFSIGGSMVSYLACKDPQAFAAYAPVAGSFWQPEPTACAGPVRLLQTHGWSDLTVPLEGRAIAEDFVQGDVFQAMQTWRETSGCGTRPDDFSAPGEFRVRSWTDCQPGARIDFALHFGGHSIPKGWATLALDWFEALP
ncbi:MAG: polyhydroxybutyrate depolymerase [Rhodobacter sp.]|nr:polyhydroxybutyrate depolymerase [Rhodobacter sp.]